MNVVSVSVCRSTATLEVHFVNCVSLVTAFMFSMSSHWSAKSDSAALALASASMRVAWVATSEAVFSWPLLAASMSV